MEEGRLTTLQGNAGRNDRRDSRGVHHSLAAVIALTLALAAALQAGFSRLATQSAIAAVISAGDPTASPEREVVKATAANRGPSKAGNAISPAARCGQVEYVFDAMGNCRAGRGAIPPPVC